MMDFLTANNVFNNSQFGFLSKKGTHDAMFHIIVQLLIHYNTSNVAAGVLCDFSKAFDCVNHKNAFAEALDFEA